MNNMKKIEALEFELDSLKRQLRISTLRENKLLKEIDAFKADVEMKAEIIAQITPGNKRNCLNNLNTRILAENEDLKKQLRQKEEHLQKLIKELEVVHEVKEIISGEKESDYKTYLDKLRYLNEKIEILTEKNNNLLKMKKDQVSKEDTMKGQSEQINILTHQNNMLTSAKNSPLNQVPTKENDLYRVIANEYIPKFAGARNNISVYLESGTSSGWLNRSAFSSHITPRFSAFHDNASQASDCCSFSLPFSDCDESKEVCRLQHAIKLKEEVIHCNTEELTKLKDQLTRIQNTSEMSNSYFTSSEEVMFSCPSNSEGCGVSDKQTEEECSSISSTDCDVKDENCECNLSKMSLQF